MPQGLRQVWRQITARPGYALVAVSTLALGIGANTAVFSMARGVLLRPLPYANGGTMVHLMPHVAGTVGDDLGFSVPEVLDYRRQARTLAAVLEYHSMAFTLLGHGEPDRVQTGVVSAGFFHHLGVAPYLGRDFRPEDELPGADPVLLLGYEYWRGRFGGDAGWIGRQLRMNDRPIRVIGVLPHLPEYPGKDRVFMPTSACPYRSDESTKANRSARLVSLWARLAPGVTSELASADVATITARLQHDYPGAAIAGESIALAPVREELVGRFRPTLALLLGTSGLVLLLACANAANLTLARLLSRGQEVVVRAALGAGRGRLVRHLLAESVTLSLLGGIAGCGLAAAGLNLLILFAHRFTARAEEIRIDGMVLAFSVALSLAAGLLSGWLPARQVLRHDLAAALRQGSGRSTAAAGGRRLRDLMVAAQVAVSCVLLIGAGLMVRSLVRLLQVDPGFRPERVLTATLELPPSKYANAPQVVGFYQRLLQSLAGDPAVVLATVASDVPMAGPSVFTPSFRVEGRPVPAGRPAPRADVHVVGADYFRTLGIPLGAGRGFASGDRTGAPAVAIVSRQLAREWWPGGSALGKRIAIDAPELSQWRTVVGVAADVRHESLTALPHATLYLPFLQVPGLGTQLFVRTRTLPSAFLADLRSKVEAIDPEQPVADVQTLAQVHGAALAPTRLVTMLLSLFAAIALVITGVGISAAVAFAVGERRAETAIRMAIGADLGSVVALQFRRAMAPVCAGLAGGSIAAAVLTRLFAGLLYGVAPGDPLALAAALFGLLAIAALTCFVPARRAARIDPIVVLRS
jgi:putative ABC transport system permease protein